MTAGRWDFAIEQGAKFSKRLEWKDANGVLVPFAVGTTAKLQIRDRPGGTQYVELSTANGRITLTTPGVIVLTLTAAETALLAFGSARHQLEIVPGGVAAETVRLLEGDVSLSLEVVT